MFHQTNVQLFFFLKTKRRFEYSELNIETQNVIEILTFPSELFCQYYFLKTYSFVLANHWEFPVCKLDISVLPNSYHYQKSFPIYLLYSIFISLFIWFLCACFLGVFYLYCFVFVLLCFFICVSFFFLLFCCCFIVVLCLFMFVFYLFVFLFWRGCFFLFFFRFLFVFVLFFACFFF